ncbi:MAG TPA: MFS transporter [Syntrophorhabdaceae bacterium]|nr:MFS transporter [Syntrophorhabdaceae bacterium]
MENPVQQTRLLNPDFIYGFFCLFMFLSAIYTLMPTLPLYLENLGSGVREIGILIGAFSASSLVLRIVVGRLLTRYSEKSIMQIGALLFALTFVALLIFSRFWEILTIRLFQGAAFACLDTAALAFVVNISPAANRARAIGHFLLGPTFALAVAPYFGMFLMNRFNFTVLFLICLFFCLCSLFVASRIHSRKNGNPVMEIPSHDQTGQIIDTGIIPSALMSLVCNFIWGALIAFLPLYALQNGVNNPGYFFSSSGLMLVLCRIGAGRILDNWKKERLIMTFMSVSTIAMVILYFSRTLSLFTLAGLLWGTGSAFFFPATMAYALDDAGSSGGTAVGTLRVMTDLGLSLGPVLTGLMIPFIGYRTMFLFLGLLYIADMSYLTFFLRRRTRLITGS